MKKTKNLPSQIVHNSSSQLIGEKNRETGIKIIGKAPWGTHFCQFYKTKEDLMDILVPYFKTGLENNEFCMWITSNPLQIDEAKKLLSKKVKNFQKYIQKGQIEILDSSESYTKSGSFDLEEMLSDWVKKEAWAREKGFDGLRLTGNTFWLENKESKDFKKYEEVVNSTISKYHMIAICSYSLDKCDASAFIDVVSNHQFVLIKKGRKWHRIEDSERKNVEEALRESESRLQRAQEISHIGSWEFDLINNLLIWSDETYRIFGLKPQEFEATYEAFLKYVHPDDRAAVDTAYSGSLRDGRNNYEIEHRIVRKNGGIRFVHEKCEHVRDETGQIIRSYGMVRDITEQKLLDEKIRHLASFPQLNPSPVIEVDQSGSIIYQNPATQKLFPDLSRLSIHHPFLSDWKPVIQELDDTNWSKNVIREITIDQSHYQQIIAPYEKNKIRLYGINITKLKEIETELRKSEEKYRNIVENTTSMIMVTKPDGIISYLSPSSTQVIGYTPNELIGTNPVIFHPDDIKKVQQALSRALKGEKGSGFEYRAISKKGQIKWISHSWSPIFLDNKLHSIVSVIDDITERRTTEDRIKKLNESLMHRSFELEAANKELETFSYSVSHDLRAPLRSIDGFSQAVLEDYADKLDKQGKEYLQRIQNSTRRMEQLIDDMLRLSRLTRTEMVRQNVDMGQIATSIIENLKKANPKRKIKFILHDNLFVKGDKNLLTILLQNLLGNAWKFTKKRKQSNIEFGKIKKEKEIVFFIRDNGAGFNMKYANKLFTPFQRLHDDVDYQGTGIGLGIASRIIHRHGGRIWAEAEEEKGAVFYFTIGGKTLD